MQSHRSATTLRLCSTISTVRVAADRFDQRADARDVLAAHAGHRLVEQHQFRVKRKRGGDFERALAAIGQFHRQRIGVGRQADIVDQRLRAVVERAQDALRAPEVERGAAPALQRDAHIFQHGEMRKHRRNLKRAPEPELRDVGGLERGDVAAVEHNASAGRRQEFGEEIEAGGLAGAVRADQRMNAAAPHAQVHAAHGDEAGELLGQVLCFEDRIFMARRSPRSRHSPHLPREGKGCRCRVSSLSGVCSRSHPANKAARLGYGVCTKHPSHRHHRA